MDDGDSILTNTSKHSKHHNKYQHQMKMVMKCVYVEDTKTCVDQDGKFMKD
jgi:hypothetical protein